MENPVENAVENSGRTPEEAGASRSFESFAIGEHHRSPDCVMTRELIQRYAELSGDRNPIHLDPEFARGTVFRDNVAHGLLQAALVTGLAYDMGLLGKNTLALESSTEEYLAPLKPGETYYGTVTVHSKEPGASRRCGRIHWDVRIYKIRESGEEQQVLQAWWVTLTFKERFLRG